MNGVSVLPFSFPASQSEDLRVYSYDTINGIQTLLTEVTDYTIAFTDATLPSAGSVTLLSSVLYNDTNFQVTLTRFTGQVNEYDMEFGQRMNPEQLEFEQDRQVQMIQDISQGLSEAVVFPTSEEVAPGANVLPTVALRANGILGFDANGDFTTSTTILNDAVAAATAASAASAAAALVSEGNASTSESNAATSESNASTSATNAGISETNAAASAAGLPTFEAPADGKIAIGNVAGTEFENSLYTMPRSFSAGDIGKLLSITSATVVSQVDAPAGGGYSGTSDKTASYTVLIGDASTKINLTTGASADATFTLPTASLTDQMRFFFRNENAFATYRLSISDGTDDIWHIGVDDGVLEIYYDADVGDWSEA